MGVAGCVFCDCPKKDSKPNSQVAWVYCDHVWPTPGWTSPCRGLSRPQARLPWGWCGGRGTGAPSATLLGSSLVPESQRQPQAGLPEQSSSQMKGDHSRRLSTFAHGSLLPQTQIHGHWVQGPQPRLPSGPPWLTPAGQPSLVSAWGHPAFSNPRTCTVMCDSPSPSIGWGRVENVGGCQPPTHVQSSVTGLPSTARGLGFWSSQRGETLLTLRRPASHQ